jgi:hypothetical protein
MPEPPLERELASVQPDPRNLALRLDRAKDSARRIWTPPRLRWFTDHTPDNHSLRIVHLLSQALEHLQKTASKLQPVELFILLAACYLHDIGMQDLKKNGKAQQEFTEQDWDRVRDDHPSIVKDWIVSRSRSSNPTQFRIDLWDAPEPYLEILGLVCQGHGSQFFASTVRELGEIHDEFDGAPVRGALLTALLMIGDELDVNQQRATTAKEENREPVSELHHSVNSYSTSVSVRPGATPQVRRATLELTTPADDDLVELVVEWLGRKLSAQSRRANAVVEPATNGELQFDPRIVFRIRAERIGLRQGLSPRAQGLLAKEVWRGRVLRPDVAARLKRALEDEEVRASAVALMTSPLGDHPSVLQWLEGTVRAEGGSHSVISCDEQGGRGPIDVLDQIVEYLALDRSRYGEVRTTVDEAMASASDTARLAAAAGADIRAAAAKGLLSLDVRGLDRASWQTRTAVADLLTEVFSVGPYPLVVLTLERSISLPIPVEKIELKELDEDVIAAHMEASLGFTPTAAAAEASTIFAVGQGSPLGVLAGLAAVERRDREIVRV